MEEKTKQSSPNLTPKQNIFYLVCLRKCTRKSVPFYIYAYPTLHKGNKSVVTFQSFITYA